MTFTSPPARMPVRNALLGALAPLSQHARLAALEMFEERAAVLEFMGDMSRADAEERAAQLTAKAYGVEVKRGSDAVG